MKSTIEDKKNSLKSLVLSLDTVAVAFSGGVDSTLLAQVAHNAHGEQAIAITVDSEAYPPESILETRALAQHIGIQLVEIQVAACDIDGFWQNTPERCYHCKKALFTLMMDKARELGFENLVDGSNVDDLGDYRPGIRALDEMGVRSPLREAGFTKDDIRAYSRELGLPTWNRQSFACLASRFPYGTEITPELLDRIGRAERVLRECGFVRYRVRHHGDIARIEVAPDELDKLLTDCREQVIDSMKALGYAYVTVDLEGYRTGSMNEVLENI